MAALIKEQGRVVAPGEVTDERVRKVAVIKFAVERVDEKARVREQYHAPAADFYFGHNDCTANGKSSFIRVAETVGVEVDEPLLGGA